VTLSDGVDPFGLYIGPSDPLPPFCGEPVNVGARPGDYCECGFPVCERLVCPNCGTEKSAA
jgi:hypothetical protein